MKEVHSGAILGPTKEFLIVTFFFSISFIFLIPSVPFAKDNGIGQCVSKCVQAGMLNTKSATACMEYCKNQRGEVFDVLITGVIRDMFTDAPIENAQIFFYGNGIGTTNTDANGSYTFTESQIRSFGGALQGNLYVGATGYFEAPPVAVSDLNTQPVLPVVEDFSLLPGGAMITGVVRDVSTGLGIPGATVSFNRDPMSTFLGGAVTQAVQTEADGSYSIDSSYFNESGLSSGFTAYLMVNADGYLGATNSINFTSYPVTQDFNLLMVEGP